MLMSPIASDPAQQEKDHGYPAVLPLRRSPYGRFAAERLFGLLSRGRFRINLLPEGQLSKGLEPDKSWIVRPDSGSLTFTGA
jgi:hypothetical protein